MTTGMSLYIPRVHNKSHTKDDSVQFNSLEEFIINVFHSLDIGSVSRVDLVPISSPSGGRTSNFSKAFVHFNHWYNNASACALQERIITSDSPDATTTARLMYDDPHYWILKPNKSKPNDRSKITSLEKQVVELNMKISSYSDLLAEATRQLSCMKSFDEPETPYKRKRKLTFSN